MKNIFKTNIIIPADVHLRLKNNNLFIVGPLGSICLNIMFLQKQSNLLNVSKKKAAYSSFLRLFQKSLIGVRLGFVSRLIFTGVGFRVESLNENFIKLKLGFSHFIFIPIPSYIKIVSPKKFSLVLNCRDEHLLKEFCTKICSLKSPDVYKGKGVFYKNQILTLKDGRSK